jgi:NhaP-type Na+/H+ or K+/H+ antiporter
VLYIFVFGGLALAYTFDITRVGNLQWYSLAVATLLTIGLYCSTYGISLTEIRRHIRLILSAVTIGVFFKAFIVGTILTVVMQNPFGFILGIIVAQIDPLSTSTLLQGPRLSSRAKSILGSWAAFDDPVTVIMSLYAPILVSFVTGKDWEPLAGTLQAGGIIGYLSGIGANLLFAAFIYVLWGIIKRYTKVKSYIAIILVAIIAYLLFVGSLSIAVYFFWMLSVAVIGLFMRPPIESILNRMIHWSLGMAAILLGIVLIDGINIGIGFVLGCAAFGAQIIVGRLLTRNLSKRDSLHIAFAQQNGITAIILALLFEAYYPGTVAIVAPAILVVNTLHIVSNKLLDIHLAPDRVKLTPTYYLKKLQSHLSKI